MGGNESSAREPKPLSQNSSSSWDSSPFLIISRKGRGAEGGRRQERSLPGDTPCRLRDTLYAGQTESTPLDMTTKKEM